MIIWGSKAKQHTVGNGNFFCPQCRQDAAFQHLRVSRYFTLYFIPLFPTSTLGEAIQCNHCGGQFNTSILQVTREQILGQLQPWVCASCGNHNPRSESTCLACGTLPAPATPPPLPLGNS